MTDDSDFSCWDYRIDQKKGTVHMLHGKNKHPSSHGPRTFEEFVEWIRTAIPENKGDDYSTALKICRDELIDRGLIKE